MKNAKNFKVKLFYSPGTWSAWWRDVYPCAVFPYGIGVLVGLLRKNGTAGKRKAKGYKMLSIVKQVKFIYLLLN